MKTMEKKMYASPKLTVYGDVATITQGGTSSGTLDKTWPVGTKSSVILDQLPTAFTPES